MSIAQLLPATLTAWHPGRAKRFVGALIGYVHSVAPRSGRPDPALPHDLVSVEPEIRAALAAAGGFARRRRVALQTAVETGLMAETDAAELRICLHHLIHGAVGRAHGSVLVTAMHHDDGVEIAVLDDATDPVDMRHVDPTQQAEGFPLPHGATMTVHHQMDEGTSIMLRLTQPDGRRLGPAPEALVTIAGSADR